MKLSVRKRRLILLGSWGGRHRGITCRDGVGLREPIGYTEAPRDLPQWGGSTTPVPEGKRGGPGVAGAPLVVELEERGHW